MWFFIGWYEDDWFKNEDSLARDKIDCTPEQVGHREREREGRDACLPNQYR